MRSLLLLAATGWAVVSALPTRPDYAKIVSRQEVQDEYDYVIVGGVTSGLTVGDRLTENGKCEMSATCVGEPWLTCA